jgi:tetratricopeptide (TPR) repeat protein
LGEKITQVDQFGFNQEQHDIYYTSMGALNRALEIEPKNAAALTELGWTYYRLEDVRDADRYLKEAIAAEPTLALAHLRLGRVEPLQVHVEQKSGTCNPTTAPDASSRAGRWKEPKANFSPQ